MKRKLQLLLVLIAMMGITVACSFGQPTPPPATATPVATEPPATPVEQPVQITGTFKYSNSIITTYYSEQAVALVDMYGFVKRDKEWEIPVASQVLGYLSIDKEKQTGSYTLQLPAKPTGQIANVANDGGTEGGVQIFAVSYWPNLTGGPYSEGDDPSRGWPTYLASAVTDTENKDEVIAGNLVVWAPDADQKFPTGFGADKLLFTADDPVGPIPAGYSIVNLDSEPFTLSQAAEPQLELFEPKDVAIKDYSGDSYTAAYDQMFEYIKLNYAFNGIEGKQPDWDKLYAEIKPRVEDAEKNKDIMAYYLALRDFTWAFKDGHVGLGGGDQASEDFSKYVEGGYGFAIRELDSGKTVVIYLLEDGPAAKAGMKVGAEVTEFNGKPIGDAISEAKPYSIQSSDFAIRYQKARYLLRATPDTEATVTFINPGGQSQTSTLKAVAEMDSFRRTSIYYGVNTDNLLPVETKILTEGNSEIGYISINSNYDDLGLIVKLFQRALEQFQAREVAGIIIDMRYNGGGAPLGLAGFLTNKEITLGQLEYYSEKTGKFEPEGLPEKFLPNVEQYHFDKMVLLVGQACYSACEIESYGFSQVPDMITVGQFPTGGVEAEVARGQFSLPEGFSLQVPTGRFTLPDGSLFLEGQGVQPTFRVPIDETTVFNEDDVVLQYGIRAVLQPLGAGITPSGQPTLLSPDDTLSAAQSSAKTFEEKAREEYSNEDYIKVPNTFTFTIALNKSETLLWAWGWCAKDKDTLADNLGKMEVKFTLNGEDIPLDNFFKNEDYANGDQTCTAYFLAIKDWKGGENHAITTLTFKQPLNDGSYDFPKGVQVFDYTIYIKP